MSVKINHFAKPIETNIKTCIEASFIELFIGLICTGFAYYTYDEAVVLFVSTAFIAVICFGLTIFNIYGLVDHLLNPKHTPDVPPELKSKP